MLRYFFGGVILITFLASFFVSEERIIFDENGKAVDGAVYPSDRSYSGVVSESAYVLYTVDGDTIAVMVGSSTETVHVRLIGVDTPETYDDSGRDTCYGEEAKEYTRMLLTNKSVTLMSDASQSNKDKYGRLLRYVFLNGENISEKLIAEGYGREYTFKGVQYQHQEEFQITEANTKEAKQGLWGVCEQ